MKDNGIIEITFHGRGGQTAVTASQLLAEMTYETGFEDAIAIPIIGAERRGAPIMAFTKVSKESKIRTYDSVKHPDYIMIFDTSLLEIPRIRENIPEDVILIINSKSKLNTEYLPEKTKTYIVDATGICIEEGFMHSSGPILNIPMLGAFGKVSGYFGLDTMETVLKKAFGERKLEKNMAVANRAFDTVKELK
ncbi:MAG: hypothetical protein EU544_06450 [Promethearchaeota archaeon]|nr:MAG: hypothetical protein EU544_06450 [Candidatus Lokiarchaeota archaeon]